MTNTVLGMVKKTLRGLSVSCNAIMVLMLVMGGGVTAWADSMATYPQDAVVTSPVALDGTRTVTVAAGVTVVYAGTVSGTGGIVKEGEGRLVLAAANTFSGGVVVNAGTVAAGRNATTAFGSGVVTVNATGENICRVQTCGGTVANAIAFTGPTSAAFEGLFIDGCEKTKTVFSGAITATGDLHLKTSNDFGELYGDYEIAEFTGSITVTSPGILAGAPHYLVNFNCPVAADVIKGYWAPSALTKDKGNHGAFKLSSTTIVANRAEIDQTRFVCGVANVFSATSVKSVYFTCEHKKNGVGSVDVNGFDQNFRSAYFEKRAGDSKSFYYLSEYVGPGEEGAEIVNSSATRATVSIGESDGSNNYSHWYVRLNGLLNLKVLNKQSDFYNRTHNLMGGSISIDKTYFRAYSGTRIEGLPTIAITSGAHTLLLANTSDPDVFPDLTELAIYKCTLTIENVQALENLSRRGNLALTFGTATGADAATLNLQGDGVLRVKSLKLYGQMQEPGEYEVNGLGGGKIKGSGKILVLGDRASKPTTAVTWKGAADADFAAEENWDGMPAGGSLSDSLTAYMATIATGSSAMLEEPAYLNGLTFGSSLTGFALKAGSGTAGSIYLSGPLAFAAKTGPAARMFSFEAPLIVSEPMTVTVPENDTLELNANSFVNAATTKNGLGDIKLSSARVDANLVVDDGGLTLSGKVEGSGTIRNNTASLYLGDAEVCSTFEIGKTVYVRQLEGSGPTNVFKGPVTALASYNVYLPQDSVTIFEGELHSNGKLGFYAHDGQTGGTIVIRNFSSGTRKDGYLHCNDSSRMILDSSGAAFACVWINKSTANLEFIRDDFFAATGSYSASLLDYGILRFDNGAVDLHGTHQVGSRLTGMASITGDTSAAIEILRGSVDGDAPASQSSVLAKHTGPISGGVSVIMNGDGEQELAGVSTSTGELVVKNGMLRLSSAATWKFSKGLKVYGGAMALDGVNQFDNEVAKLEIRDASVIFVANRASFKSATVNGIQVAPGRYTEARPGPFVGHLMGAGSVRVGRQGLVLVVR